MLVGEVIFVGLTLSADSFSAALAMGTRPFSKNDAFRFAFTSGGAEASVALAGAIAGTHVIRRFGDIDHWIAFALLSGVALHMAYEGVSDLLKRKERTEVLEFHSLGKVLIVSFATSLDALGVGVGLGVSHKPIVPFIISIGCWAVTATLAGLYLARILSKNAGPIFNLLGAIVLGVLAIQMLKI